MNKHMSPHGDYDHMGEAINLVENFRVKKVIFNCGEFNELTKELIQVLDKKKISYYSCIKELNIDNNKLHFLNNKNYGNENDNSSVICTEINNYKFLFMGEAGVEVGKKYNRSTLFRMKQFYNVFSNEKVAPLVQQLSWSHYSELLSIKDINS